MRRKDYSCTIGITATFMTCPFTTLLHSGYLKVCVCVCVCLLNKIENKPVRHRCDGWLVGITLHFSSSL